MSTTITLEFPDLPGDLNEDAVAMACLRRAMLASEEARRMYAGQMITMTGPESFIQDDESVGTFVSIGGIKFPEDDHHVRAAFMPDGECHCDEREAS